MRINYAKVHKTIIFLTYLIYIFKLLFSSNYIAFNIIFYSLLFLISFFNLRYLNKNNRNYYIFLIIICFFIFMFIKGVINKNWYNFILSDAGRFALMSFILYGNQKDFNKLYSNLGGYLYIGLPISIFLIIYYGIKPGILEQRFISSGDIETSTFFIIIYPVFHSLFLFPSIDYFKIPIRIIIIISVFFIMIYSFVTLNRLLFITSTLSILSGLICSRIRMKIKIFLLVISIILVIQFISFKDFNLSESLKDIFYRLQPANDLFSGRDVEAEAFINSLKRDEIILGRGFGGTQKSWIWSELPYGNNMIHFGFLYILMKGGVLFLFFMISILIVGFLFLVRKKGIYVPIAIGILIFIVADFMHTQWLYPFNIIYLFASISFGFNNVNREKIKSPERGTNENIIIKCL